jgi:hypothetical protein
MSTGGDSKAQASMGKGARFIERSNRSGVPANVFVVLDTHSDNKTGGLQWGGGTSKPKYSPVSQVVRRFCGEEFLAAMKAAATKARGTTPPSGAETEWYDDSVYSRGGWRALLLSTCSPAFRVERSFNDIRELVAK